MPLIIDGRLEHYLWIALSVMYCGICLLVVTQVSFKKNTLLLSFFFFVVASINLVKHDSWQSMFF